MKKRTKALEIPMKVKNAVGERDSCEGHPCCIWCGKPAPVSNPLGYSNAHYIPRSQGGLGIEQNILTLCTSCHSRYDNSADREDMRKYFEKYLSKKYSDWTEEELIYKKGGQ